MDFKQQNRDTYNASAEAMAKNFNSMGARVEDVARGLSLVQKASPFVLEIGCGNGREAVEILKYTDHYLGIDISQSMIDIARNVAPEGVFEVADVELYQFPQGIDIIFSFASLLHSDRAQVEKIFREAHGSLNSDAIFYISLKYGEGSHTKTDAFGTRTYFFYTPEVLQELAGDLYETLWQDTHELREQTWFAIVFRKK